MTRLARVDSQTSKGLGVKTGRSKVKSSVPEKKYQKNKEKKHVVNDFSGDKFGETIPPTPTKTRIPRIRIIGTTTTPTPTKPKKTPRIRIIGGEPLSKIWADHGTDQATHHLRNETSEEPTDKGEVATGELHESHKKDLRDECDGMSLDSECEAEREMATRSSSSKSADHVHNVASKWGKGTECVIEWGFRQNAATYTSKGIVVGRSARKGNVKIKISYEPAPGNEGPNGFLYLPQSNKIKIYSLRATKLLKVETTIRNLEEQADDISSEDGQSDLEPLPPMAQIDPSFSVHVVAIFRAIIRGYSAVKLDSEKAAIWHKFLNAPRDSLATVRQMSRRKQSIGHARKTEELSTECNLSADEREELQVDRRSIRNALTTARASNLGKATRIIDNVYRDSVLTADEKVQKLKELHPEGHAIQIPETDFPRIGIVEKSELRLAVDKLARGASPGPSGLSESMMRLLGDDDESSLSLCHMIRDVINGEIPLCVRKRLTRCRIIALPKPQNGIRPVAMGDTILKICGSILLQRHESSLKAFFAPIQRGVLCKNACESIIHELLQEYEDGHALLAVDFSNAYNTPRRDTIAQALTENSIFKPFMRLFYLEYGLPSELLFFAHNSLFATIESTSGIRQGSALSSMYFCALLQAPLREVASLYPDVKIRAYQDDVTLSSKNVQSLEAAFLHLREITGEFNLHVKFQKCEWFQKDTPRTDVPLPLEQLGVNFRTDAIKILGAYIGADEVVENLLLQKMEKHKCLFRRLLLMGPSNLSLAILRRCTIPRQDYHLRVHRPNATLRLAQSFETQVHRVLQKWCGADENALKLAALPQKLGGLGLISSTLKQKFCFESARTSIEEQFKPIYAPVDITGGVKAIEKAQSRGELSQRLLKKKISNEHEKQLAELQKNTEIEHILKRTKESNFHLESTSNYVNPYLFRYTLKMRLGISLSKTPAKITCPGCCSQESPSNIIPHVAGCSRCSGMNCTRKHSHIVRYLAELCSKAGLPSVIEPRIHSSYYCTKCKCTISAEVSEQHPCKARRIRSGPDIAIMWPHMGEVLYDFTVVHTCCTSYVKQTSNALLQQAIDRKIKKYVTEKGVDSDSFRCLATTDCGLLHSDTKALLKALAHRAQANYENVRHALQLEIEKMGAYTVVSQLREYIPKENWIGGLRF